MAYLAFSALDFVWDGLKSVLVCFLCTKNANATESWDDPLPELTRDELSDCPRSSNSAGGEIC